MIVPSKTSAARPLIAILLAASVAAPVPATSSTEVWIDGFELGQPAQPACASVPAGWRVWQLSWDRVFRGIAPLSYPQSPSWLQPVGQFTLDLGGSERIDGQIITTSFVADGAHHRVTWEPAQAVWAGGYFEPQRAQMGTVVLSSCAADLEAPCQATANRGTLSYGPAAIAPECRVVPGQTYWLSFHFGKSDHSPSGNTCRSSNLSGGRRCDVNVNHY